MSEKKYTPKEAAFAVLAKAAEIAKKYDHTTKLVKSEENANSVAGAQGESLPKEDPMKMSEEAAPAKPTKGHIKLAKFVGAMEAKRGTRPGSTKEMDKGETGHETGINTSGDQANGGQSRMGNHVAMANEAKQHYGGGKVHLHDAKNVAKDNLGQMKQMPKPKLPG